MLICSAARIKKRQRKRMSVLRFGLTCLQTDVLYGPWRDDGLLNQSDRLKDDSNTRFNAEPQRRRAAKKTMRHKNFASLRLGDFAFAKKRRVLIQMK